MKYCPFCGSGLQEAMVFCPKCGKRFLDAFENPESADSVKLENDTVETLSPAQELAEHQAIDVTNVESAVVSTTEQSTKKIHKKALLGITILAIVLGILGFFCLNGLNETSAITDATNSVLYLEVCDDAGAVIATASGFIIEDGATLITNYHVIDGAHSITAYTPDGSKSVEVYTVLAYDKVIDLAVLKCEDSIGVTPLQLGDSDTIKQGDEIFAVGYPLGVANTLSNGLISSRYLDENNIDTLQITAAVSSGSSGGALLNTHGQVIGVVCASYHDGQNMNIAIPCSYIGALCSDKSKAPITLKQLYSAQYPDEYYVGLRTISITPTEYDSAVSWDNAQKTATDIYEEWLSGERTETSLMSIMEKYGKEQGGGKLYIILPGEFVEEIDVWCFEPARKSGDTAIIENPYGYSICYFSGKVVKTDIASDILQRKAAEQALEIDRKYGPGAYGGSEWLNLN